MKQYFVQKKFEGLAIVAGRAALVVYAFAALLQVTGGVVA